MSRLPISPRRLRWLRGQTDLWVRGGLIGTAEADRILVPGGRGVFLMRRLVDEVSFSVPGNRVRLVKRR